MQTLEPVRFDAYTATTCLLKPDEALDLFNYAGMTRQVGRGFHTFAERVSVHDSSGDQVGSVSYGGRQGGRVMVEVKGYMTPTVVSSLRDAVPHRCTRVDACADFERPAVFDELLDVVLSVKKEFKLYGERRGDWEMPELGRTQTLGADSSAVKARLYEKGKQPEYRHLLRPNLCRLEVEIRPAKDAKDTYSMLSPMQVWGASKWTRRLASDVLEQMLDPVPPGTVRRDSQRDRALKWMCAQYGPHLVSLAADLGSWACLGQTLQEMVSEERDIKQRIKRGLGQ